MYNRYVGNTGRFVRVDDDPVIPEREAGAERAGNRSHPDNGESAAAQRRAERAEEPLPASRGGGGLSALLGGGGGLLGGTGLLGGRGLRFLDNVLPFGMDTGDLALIVLFFFLYIESGDEEFLIIMAFLAYSIFKDRPKKLL